MDNGEAREERRGGNGSNGHGQRFPSREDETDSGDDSDDEGSDTEGGEGETEVEVEEEEEPEEEEEEEETDAVALRAAAADARLAPVFLGISCSCAMSYRSRGAHLVIAAHCLFSLFVMWAARSPRSRFFKGPQRRWYRGRTRAIIAAVWRLSFSGGAQVNAGLGRGPVPPASAREMKALAFWAR